MPALQRSAMDTLKQIGPPQTLREAAAEHNSLLPGLLVNAHIHLPPNFSAFHSIDQAVLLAAQQGVSALGASNYYDYSLYDEFARSAARQHIFSLFGLEVIALLDDLQREGIKLNDPGNPGKMYLCGKGITRFSPLAPEAASLLEVIRTNDAARMEKIVLRLSELFAEAGMETGLTAEQVKEQIVKRCGCPKETVTLQERHAAQAFQEALFARLPADKRAAFLEKLFGPPCSVNVESAPAVQNDLRANLLKAGKPGYVEETFVDFDHAYRLTLALGGIPCYPVLADGANPVCGFEKEPEELAAELKSRSIFAAEFIPLRNSPETLSRYVKAFRQAGIVVTAGTEHNTLDLLPIEPACLKGAPVPQDIQEIFREGACVAAAHQYLSAWGEEGYVNDMGALNAAFSEPEERIRWFHALGAEVIRRSIEQLLPTV